MSKYKVSFFTLITNYGAVLFLTVLAIFITVMLFENPNMEGNWFAILWILGVFLYLVPRILKMPYAITLNKDLITFKTLIMEKKYK